MKRYLVIADDITGSNDTGVQLTRRGIDTIVTVNPHGIRNDANSYVLDCESRSLSGSDAYSVVKNCLAHINLADFDCVIKKVDSTIRGNVAEETMAVDEAIGAELVLFAPALPNLHRTTKNAIHMLNGVPVSQTEIANDPKTPVKNDNLIGVLSAVYDEPIGHISLSDIRNRQICFDSHRVYAADSVTNADMETLVREAMKTGKKGAVGWFLRHCRQSVGGRAPNAPCAGSGCQCQRSDPCPDKVCRGERRTDCNCTRL